MKLKDSAIKDFAEALGDDTIDDVEIGEARQEHYQMVIPKVSVRNNLRHIFSPLLEVKDCILKLLSCVCFLVCLPITLILSALEYDSRRRIKILYLYFIKHRKEIKAYKEIFTREQGAEMLANTRAGAESKGARKQGTKGDKMIDEIKAKLSRTSFYIALSLILLFYIAGFVYTSMFAYSYENDVDVDFVVFTIEHYYTILIVIVILPFMCGLFIVGLLESPYWTYEQEEGLFALAMFGGIFYVMVMTFFFCFGSAAIKMNQTDITKEQRGIIVDLVKQEKISRNSVKATREIKVDADAYIGRKPLELEVCFKKGFHNPICAKLFENFLIKEKEEVRREKAREYLAEKNKIESIENYNRIIEKVK